MAAHCANCGSPVDTPFCQRCGARQPTPPLTPTPVSDLPPEQPWQPFEQPPWSSGYVGADDPASRPPLSSDNSFMGVSSWQTVQPPRPRPTNRRGNWILGGLAVLAVIAVLVAITVVVLNRGSETATPDPPPATTTSVSTATSSTSPSISRSAAPAPVTTTVITTAPGPAGSDPATTTEASASTAPSEPTATTVTSTAVVDPLGGPVQDIPCSAGYITQIASAPTEAELITRVDELRRNGQLPADVRVARTGSSCQIWTGTTNSLVLYAGPFTDPSLGCAARVGGAPDSFIRGTTPETGSQFSYCLCVATASSLPLYSSVGDSGVWIGELQRFLVSRLKVKLPVLDNSTWGLLTPETAAALQQFKSDHGLPANSEIDGATWQELQAAGC